MVEDDLTEIEKLILAALDRAEKPLSIKELAQEIPSVSYPTVLKWVEVLNGKNLCIISDFGNIRLVSSKEKNFLKEKS